LEREAHALAKRQYEEELKLQKKREIEAVLNILFDKCN